MSDVNLLLQTALAHQQRGELHVARPLYQQVLEAVGPHPVPLRLLGLTYYQEGQFGPALELIGRAAGMEPRLPETFSDLAAALAAVNRPAESRLECERALALMPAFPAALCNRGDANSALGELSDAVTDYRRATVVQGDFMIAHHRLAKAQKLLGRAQQSVESCRRALTLDPGFGDAWVSEGVGLVVLAHYREALVRFDRALRLLPADVNALYNKGVCLLRSGLIEAAANVFASALAAFPYHAHAWNNLAYLRQEQRQSSASLSCSARALALDPAFAEALINLGKAWKAVRCPARSMLAFSRVVTLRPNACESLILEGLLAIEGIRYADAIDRYGRALLQDPGNVDALDGLSGALTFIGAVHEALKLGLRAFSIEPHKEHRVKRVLHLLCYVPDLPPDQSWRIARQTVGACSTGRFAAAFPKPSRPDGRLRLGFVSSDFRRHPVAANSLPLFETWDRTRFEIACYSDVEKRDETTARFEALSDLWVPSNTLDDSALAARIRADRIDILIIMAPRFDGNRALLAAQRAAPVQVNWYDAATSAVDGMDYLISDRTMVPRNTAERFSERVIRLPSLVVYEPIKISPPVNELPALRAGHLTFGSFNNPTKINDQVLAAWRDLLLAIPDAVLHMRFMSHYADPALRGRILDGLGPVSRRVVFLPGEILAQADHLALYQSIDLALDTFPFSGSTTSFEALWMGVPVLTMPGCTMMSRWTYSMLRVLGLESFGASDTADMITIARRLSNDLEHLNQIRNGLRLRVARSPLCNVKARGRQLQRVFRAVWAKECVRNGAL